MGRVVLTTEGEPVVVQVLEEEKDGLIGEAFDLARRAVVTLPEGEYRLRVDGKGRLGRTYRFAVNRGETQTHPVSIDEGRLLGGEPNIESTHIGDYWRRGETFRFAPVTRVVELTPGVARVIEWSNEHLICRDGARGGVIWDAFHPAKPFDRGHDPAPWMRNLFHKGGEGRLVEPAVDLDGDGTGDLLWYFRKTSGFLALSGKDGSMLWNYVADLDGPGGPQRDGPALRVSDGSSKRQCEISGAFFVPDVDRDGASDAVATVIFSESAAESKARHAKPAADPSVRVEVLLFRQVIVAISGRTGRWLWAYPVDREFGAQAEEEWRRLAMLVPGRRTELVAFVNGMQWFGLDAVTGRLKAGPVELGSIPVRTVQHADLDGDGEPEIVALGTHPTGKGLMLRAFSTETGRELWAETVDAFGDQSGDEFLFPDCPLIADLDGDGRPEILVADAGTMPPLSGYRGVRLIDGVTGGTRWRRPMRPHTANGDGVVDSLVAPDLDGDGTRDVVTVSLFDRRSTASGAGARASERTRIYVDALSGKDGRALWWWSGDLPPTRFRQSRAAARWWGRGPDGWPLLAVPSEGTDDESQSLVVSLASVRLLEASTGRERHAVIGLRRPEVADVDGDGLGDLWGEVDGELRVFRGEAPEAWRALGEFDSVGSSEFRFDAVAHSAVDLDGDGISDTLNRTLGPHGLLENGTHGSRHAVARSGRDGHVIWNRVVDDWRSWFEPKGGRAFSQRAFPLPGGDFDGDGTPDVIVTKDSEENGRTFGAGATLLIQVLSGRTGGRLWSAGRVPGGFAAHGDVAFYSIDVRAAGSGSSADLFVRFYYRVATPGSSGKRGLARISGRDGRILWAVELPTGLGLFRETELASTRDGSRSSVDQGLLFLEPVVGPGAMSWNMFAIAPGDGKALWMKGINERDGRLCAMQMGDLNADGREEVVIMNYIERERQVELRAFDGRDGAMLWSWRGDGRVDRDPFGFAQRVIVARLGRESTTNVCVCFNDPSGTVQIVVLDGDGKERGRVAVTGDDRTSLRAADLDGDGRDELLAWYAGRVHALNGDLKEVWSWPTKSWPIDKILPGSSRGPSAVIVAPGLALDGVTGRPRWTGQAPLVDSGDQFVPRLLDRGDSRRSPLLIGDGLGATVCRTAMEVDSRGRIVAARGAVAVEQQNKDDPRWARPLPWVRRLTGALGPLGFGVASGLALVNVVLPLLILRLGTGGRRVSSVRALMLLPLAAAVPLSVFLTLAPGLPLSVDNALLGSESRVFVTWTLAGLPIALCVVEIVGCLIRKRWRPIVVLMGLTVVMGLVVAGGWVWIDGRSMAALEHYEWEGWGLVVLLGGYAAAVFWVFGKGVVGGWRVVGRRRGWTDSRGR